MLNARARLKTRTASLEAPSALILRCAQSAPRRMAASSAAALALLAAPALADDADTIVVSATKSPLALSEVGSAVAVIDAATIETRQYRFVADALAETAGLAIARNGAFGGQAALRIRGEASGRTLVLIDGGVVNDPSAPGGGFNFASLDIADIERIEIVRGPQSILYGSEAIGGVVAITTRKGEGPASLRAFAEGGSFATFRGGAGVSGARGGADYALSVFGLSSDGVSRFDGGAEADGIDSYGASASLGADLSDALRLETSLRFSDATTDFDGFPPPAFAFADTADIDKNEEILATGRAILKLFDGGLENAVTIGYHAIDRVNLLGDAVTFEGEGNRLSAEYLARARLSEKISLVAGAESERTAVEVSGVDDDVTINSVFGLAVFKPFAALTLTGGLRHDDHGTFGGETTARVTGAYDVGGLGLTLRGSWGEGFAAPTLFQLNFVCCGGAEPNRLLQPETSAGFDIGFDKTLGPRAELRATFFRQETENQIDFDFPTGAYVNLSAARRKGVEAELAYAPTDRIDLSLAYAFIDAEDVATGLPLLRQPRHALTLAGDVRPLAGLSLGASFRYNGAERDGAGPIDAWTRLDLRAAYALSDAVEIYGRVENAADADYQDVLGYGEPGVSAFAGVRVRL